jgi:phage shock protein A
MSERIETKRTRVKEAKRIWDESFARPVAGVEWVQAYATDVSDLLQRVEELEQERLGLIMEIQRLKDKLKEQDERIAEIRKGAEF